jgi:hypothetical protein
MRPFKALRALEGMLLLLERPLYGLKQSSKEWYIEAYKGLKTLRFIAILASLLQRIKA